MHAEATLKSVYEALWGFMRVHLFCTATNPNLVSIFFEQIQRHKDKKNLTEAIAGVRTHDLVLRKHDSYPLDQ